MSVESFLADPALPQLEVASDPESMKETFRIHLRPLAGKVYDIEDCRLSRIRYRQGSRCFLQYTLRLVEPGTGRERNLKVTGIVYAEKNRAERTWRKLRATDPGQKIPEPWLTFEPVSFVPELGMLVQVFPFDRRLPSLPLLAAGPPPGLEPLLLARFGSSDWRIEAWNIEPVRYREQLGAVLRYTAQARNAATDGRREKRFYVKVYRDERGEQTYQVLRALWSKAGAREAFTVVRPVAYLSDLRTLILEEAPGTSLEEILLRARGTTGSARRVARALADFNQGNTPTTRRHLLADQVSALERAGRLIGWACPHLGAKVEAVIEGILAELEEVPLRPTHRDLKADHVFLDGNRTVFIDLDSFAKADPVLDPAHLLARLAVMPTLFPVPPQRTQMAAREFAKEYCARVPAAWCARLPLHYAGALLEVAHGLFRRQAPDWPGRIATLVEEAEDSVAGKVW